MERDVFQNLSAAPSRISTHTLTWSVTGDEITPATLRTNFNSHAHVERDVLSFGLRISNVAHFNSHAHVERDVAQHTRYAVLRDFNSHAHVERDCKRHISCRRIVYFNSHAHVERDLLTGKVFCGHCNFNSHAHVERDKSYTV